MMSHTWFYIFFLFWGTELASKIKPLQITPVEEQYI